MRRCARSGGGGDCSHRACASHDSKHEQHPNHRHSTPNHIAKHTTQRGGQRGTCKGHKGKREDRMHMHRRTANGNPQAASPPERATIHILACGATPYISMWHHTPACVQLQAAVGIARGCGRRRAWRRHARLGPAQPPATHQCCRTSVTPVLAVSVCV